MRISKTSFDILNYLVVHNNVTYADICKELNISEKTLKEYLDEILYELKCVKDIKIIIKPGEGIKVEGNLAKIIDDIEINRDYISDKDSREVYVLSRLLQTNNYIKIIDLAEEMYISRSTLENTLREIRERKIPKGLTYVSNRNGIKIEGSDIVKRKMLTSVMKFYWGGLVADDKELRIKIDINYNNSNFIDSEVMEKLTDIINDFIKENNIFITEYEYQSLIIHIAIAIERIKNGNYLHSSDKLEINESKTAASLINQIEEEFKIIFPVLEKDYIAIHMNAIEKKVIYKKSKKTNLVDLEYKNELIEIIENTIINKNNNIKALNNMILHLNAAIRRLKLNVTIKNPYKIDIKKGYPLAFSQSVTLGRRLEQRFSIKLNEDELSFIALHIQMISSIKEDDEYTVVLVCSSGYGTSKFLEQRILNKFKDKIKINRVLSIGEYLNTDIIEDLVISTIPIENSETPVIVVSPMLNEVDVKKIESKVSYEEFENKYIENNEFINLISLSMIKISNKYNENYKGVLKYITDKLLESGLAEKGILDNVLQREELSSTALDDFSMPHSNIEYIKQPIIYVYINENGIDWDGDIVYVVFFFGLNQIIKDKIFKIYEFFNHFISDKNNINTLRYTKDEKDVIKILSRGVRL